MSACSNFIKSLSLSLVELSLSESSEEGLPVHAVGRKRSNGCAKVRSPHSYREDKAMEAVAADRGTTAAAA